MKDLMRTYITEYITHKTAQDAMNDKMFDAIAVIAGGTCDYEPMVYPYYKFMEDTMTSIIGDTNMEWINWFMYERGMGDNMVIIDGVSHDITTVNDLIKYCINTKECNKQFFKSATK